MKFLFTVSDFLLNQIKPVKVSSLNEVIAPLLDKVG